MSSNRNIEGNLSNKGYTDSNWNIIIEYLQKHQGLEILDLSSNQLIEVPTEFLQAIANHPTIKSVNLDNNYKTKTIIHDREYNRDGRDITKPDKYVREDMPQSEKAKVSVIAKIKQEWGGVGNFRQKKLEDRDWNTVIKCLQENDKLEILDLSNNHFMTVPNVFLKAVANHPNIKSINLDNNYQTKIIIHDREYNRDGRDITKPDKYVREDMPESEKAKVSNIATVKKEWGVGNFRQEKLEDRDWDTVIKCLQENDKLEILDLSGNHFMTVPDTFLKAVANHPNIKSVNLNDNSLSTYIKGYTDRGPRDTDIEIPGRWETQDMPEYEKRKVSDIAKIKQEWGVGNLRSQGLSDQDWQSILNILTANEQLTTLNLTNNNFKFVPHNVIEAIKNHKNLLTVAINEGATKSQIDKVINEKFAIRNLEKASGMVDSVLEDLKDKNLSKKQLNELLQNAQFIISAVENIERKHQTGQHMGAAKIRAREGFKALEQMLALVTNIQSTEQQVLDKAFEHTKILVTMGDNVVAKENICKTILSSLKDTNISISQMKFLGRVSELLNMEDFNKSRDELILDLVVKINKSWENNINKDKHDHVAESLPLLYAALESMIAEGRLNAPQELFDSLDKVNKALFNQKITADVYKKAIAAINKAKLGPHANTKFNKMHMARSIEKNGRLQGGTLYESDKIDLLRQLEKTFTSKELQDPEYQSIKRNCFVSLVRAKVMDYAQKPHDYQPNVTRAKQFLEIIKTMDSDSKMYEDMLRLLSSDHKQLKNVIIESLEIQFNNVPFPKIEANVKDNQKIIEERISTARKCITNQLEKDGFVPLTINKNLRIIEKTKADELLKQWKEFAEYVANHTYDRDFSTTSKFGSTTDDPRKAIGKAKTLSELHTAVEQLKSACTSWVGNNSIASALTTISNGIDSLKSPTHVEAADIKKAFKQRQEFRSSSDHIKKTLAGLNQAYGRSGDSIEFEITKILGLLKEEGYASAQNACLKLIRSNPHSTKPLWLSGMIYREASEDKKAQEQFEKIVAQEKDRFGKNEAKEAINPTPSAPTAKPEEIKAAMEAIKPSAPTATQEEIEEAPSAPPATLEEIEEAANELNNFYWEPQQQEKLYPDLGPSTLPQQSPVEPSAQSLYPDLGSSTLPQQSPVEPSARMSKPEEKLGRFTQHTSLGESSELQRDDLLQNREQAEKNKLQVPPKAEPAQQSAPVQPQSAVSQEGEKQPASPVKSQSIEVKVKEKLDAQPTSVHTNKREPEVTIEPPQNKVSKPETKTPEVTQVSSTSKQPQVSNSQDTLFGKKPLTDEEALAKAPEAPKHEPKQERGSKSETRKKQLEP